MTPDPRTALEEKARAFLAKHYSQGEQEGPTTLEALTNLLLSTQAEVLEEAQQYAADCEKVETDRSSILTAHKIAYWCEKQAKERRP